MGELSEFSLPTRLFLKSYRWRRLDPIPWAPLRRPLRESRLALVSTAGFVLPHQERFDGKMRGGDPSFRTIPSDADSSDLVDAHRSESFDHTGMQQDPELAFPLERARELVERGRIGSLSPHHLSFMGSLTAPGRLVKRSAPEAVEGLLASEVDIALLVPV